MSSKPYYRIANGALLLAAVAYAIVWGLGFTYDQQSWYAPAYWITQSALIGGVADWFAVTALFRRPLGISYHTELVPRNKARLVKILVTLVESKFLSRQQLEIQSKRISFVEGVNRIVQSADGRELISRVITVWLTTYNDTAKRRQWIEKGSLVALALAENFNFSDSLRRNGIEALDSTEGQQLVLKIMHAVEQALENPRVSYDLEELIDQKLNKKVSGLNWLFLQALSLFDLVNTRDMALALQKEAVVHIRSWQNPNSEGYDHILMVLRKGLQSLEYDKETSDMLQSMYIDWLHSIPLPHIIEKFVWPHLSEHIIGNGKSASEVALLLTDKLIGEWAHYIQEPEFRNTLEEALRHIVIALLNRFHPAIGTIAYNVLDSFSTERFNQFIEDKVGEDLGWIRINGVVLGGVLGLIAWSLLHFVYDPILATL